MENKKVIAAIDTETTGLIYPSACKLDQQPYIHELCIIKYTEDGEQIDKLLVDIKPPIPLPDIIKKISGRTDAYFIGKPSFVELYKNIANFMVGVDIMTAHNLAFDRNMLANELLRIDKVLQFPWPPVQICTVKASKVYEGYRLNLTKLHEYLFNKGFEDAHSAFADVEAQARCFFKMVERGDIVL